MCSASFFFQYLLLSFGISYKRQSLIRYDLLSLYLTYRDSLSLSLSLSLSAINSFIHSLTHRLRNSHDGNLEPPPCHLLADEIGAPLRAVTSDAEQHLNVLAHQEVHHLVRWLVRITTCAFSHGEAGEMGVLWCASFFNTYTHTHTHTLSLSLPLSS